MPTVDTPRITATGTYPRITVNVVTGATGPGGGGAVDSVNGQTGTVVLDAGDVGALPDDTVVPDITGLQATSEKNQPNGYAGLDGDGTIPDNRIPASIARDTEIGTQIAAHDESETAHPDIRALMVPKSLVDAKGDLFVGTADNTVARLPVGSNGTVLTADSTQTVGAKWSAVGDVRLVPSARASSTGALLVPVVAGALGVSADVLAPGRSVWAKASHVGGTLDWVALEATGTALSVGQTVIVAAYTEVDAGPGVQLWAQPVTVGDTTGEKSASGLSLTIPSGHIWFVVHNPNAATVTIRTGAPITHFGYAGTVTSVPNLDLSGALPSDVSSFPISSGAGTINTVFGLNKLSRFPRLIGRAA